MSKSLYSRVNKVYFRSYLLFNIVASSAYMKNEIAGIFLTNTSIGYFKTSENIKKRMKS